MSAIQDRLLQAGVNADNFHVGPAVVLIQDEASWSLTANDGTGFPRYIDDVVNLTSGAAMSANGWAYLGYTLNLNPQRNRTTTYHDADQEARVEETHDVWEDQITVGALEMTLAKLNTFWQGKSTDPSTVAGATTAQQKVDFGSPTALNNRRVAIVYPDKLGYVWAFVYRKCNIRPTGGPTFSRTGQVEIPLTISIKPDTRQSDVDQRKYTVFRTTAVVS